MQQTTTGMFRTTLHQLLSQVPLAGADFRTFWKGEKKWECSFSQDSEWRIEELREAFSSALLTAAKSHTIVIFVDALDEAGHVSSQEIVHYFHELNEQLSGFKTATSFCFLCSHFPVFVIRTAFEACVENENQVNIVNYVHAELKLSLFIDDLEKNPDEVVNDLQPHITEKAFL